MFERAGKVIPAKQWIDSLPPMVWVYQEPMPTAVVCFVRLPREFLRHLMSQNYGWDGEAPLENNWYYDKAQAEGVVVDKVLWFFNGDRMVVATEKERAA